MSRSGRTLLHAILLCGLVAGALYGAMMLFGYLMMAVSVAMGRSMGWMSTAELTASQISFGVIMVALWGGVITMGLAALVRQGRQSIALAQWVDRTSELPSPKLAAAVRRAGAETMPAEVPSNRAYAFTHRIWRPQIVVSSGLVDQVTSDELVAVLRHEDCHVRNRDPLKVLAFRTWAAAFSFLPLVKAVLHRLLERQELMADRAAVHECGVAPVAGALLKAVGEPETAPGTALAAMGGPALLEERITHLETGQVPGVLAAVPPAVTSSLPGVALLGVYGTLLYQVCVAVEHCCA